MAYAVLANFGESPLITTTSQFYQKKIPGPCLAIRPEMFPLNTWAQNKVNAPMMNIDGLIVPNDSCLYRCDNSGNNQTVPTPFQPRNSYYIPGGVVSATRFFKAC